MRAFPRLPTILLASALALAACDSPTERAEQHYQRATELLAAGDAERAMVEFRNVFRLNNAHVAARAQYAALLRDQGDLRGALSQYLRLVEQDPGNAAAYRDLTEVALRMQDFETAEVNIVQAFKLDPADPMTRALKATLDYRRGGDRAGAVAMAEGVTAEAPEIVPAQMVVIADRMAANDPAAALARADTALAAVPGDEGLHLIRLGALEALGDMEGIGTELKTMTALFPDNAGVREGLIRWHLHQGDPDAAEAILRAHAAETPDDPAPALVVVQFLLEVRGPEAARAELEARIAASADPHPYQRALAGLDFAQGAQDKAIAALRALVEGAEPSDGTRDLQVALAEMLAATGAAEESAALIETVLAGDKTNVAALKLRARAAIEADRPEAAIEDMRAALAQAPRDPEIMTIMAMAHEREGSRELMGERLSLAVETSDRAPEESLRYANFLMQDGRTGPAEGVVVDALRRAPENRELLNMLGRIHLARKDWARADQVAGILRAQGDPVAAAMAAALTAQGLAGQGRTAETVALLEDLAGTEGNAAAMADLVRTQVAAGDTAAAQAYLDDLLAREPASLPGRLLQAGLWALGGETDRAEALYRTLIEEAPGLAQPYQALFALLAGQGRVEEAEAVLAAGIAAAEDSAPLMFMQAGVLEAKGDLPGAVAVYEALYARDSSAPVVANNLASLLTSQDATPDPAVLERAFAIARRLRASEVPQFRDTYGWILHLRGDSAQALTYLVPAAEALPDNAQAQFHRAEAEFRLEHWDAARTGFEQALAAAEAGSPLPPAQAAAARARLAAIDARPAPEPETRTGSEG